MGRSGTSCFKIIACGGSTESVDIDEIDASSENKGSDKRGWSFRKRSARHRVLSNTIVTEVVSSENKESSEPIIINSEAEVNPTPITSEKISDNQWTEELPRLSTSITKDVTVSTMVTEAPCEEDIQSESNLDESAILVIQAAVRRFLAEREVARHKNAVKLQAAVRGHLVRNHAVGTLRCVQAIVKMQALIRARRANLSAVGEKGVQNPGTKLHPTYISIEKLLNNKFAQQLLESTPKTKQINIKCNPSRSDSAWNWLERWMSVSSPDTIESHAPEPNQDQNKANNTEKHIETVVEAAVPSEDKENSIHTQEISNVASHEEEKPQPANTHESDPLPEEYRNSKTEKTVASENEPKRPAKRLATDQADSEGRKSVFGSRKASNPAFIAAQSRFEELTSKNNSLKSVDSSNQDTLVGSSAPETETETPDEYLVSHSSRVVPNGGSECGTELSVTSTLDSPDNTELVNKKPEEEAKVIDESAGDTNNDNNKDVKEHAFPIVDTTPDSVTPEKHNADVDVAEIEKLKPDNSSAVSKRDQNLDESASDADIELEPESGHHVYKPNALVELERESGHHVYNNKSSLEGSPRSHMTVPESQGTPSSQISTNSKKTASDKTSQKRKSWSSTKKSPSPASSSLEQLPKESKPGKRRNSFGSPRPDYGDQEARDSSGNNSLPSYMQATESARAKALANNSSPRSSPDVQDKEVYIKKRHSLPGAVNGRQGSPRIQRSMSQALQTTKGNGNPERKWQR